MRVLFQWDGATQLPALKLVTENSGDRMVLEALSNVELLVTVERADIPVESVLRPPGDHSVITGSGVLYAVLSPINQEDTSE